MHSAEGQQEDGKHILSSGSSTEGGEEQQPGGTHHQTHCSPCVLRKFSKAFTELDPDFLPLWKLREVQSGWEMVQAKHCPGCH